MTRPQRRRPRPRLPFAPASLNRQVGTSFANLLRQFRPLTTLPEPYPMDDPVSQRAAVAALDSFQRPVDAYELALQLCCGRANGRVTVAAEVEQRQMRSEIRV